MKKGVKARNRRTSEIGFYTGESEQLFFDTHVYYFELKDGTVEGWVNFSIIG